MSGKASGLTYLPARSKRQGKRDGSRAGCVCHITHFLMSAVPVVPVVDLSLVTSFVVDASHSCARSPLAVRSTVCSLAAPSRVGSLHWLCTDVLPTNHSPSPTSPRPLDDVYMYGIRAAPCIFVHCFAKRHALFVTNKPQRQCSTMWTIGACSPHTDAGIRYEVAAPGTIHAPPYVSPASQIRVSRMLCYFFVYFSPWCSNR